MKPELKEYIKANIQLIDELEYETLYKQCPEKHRSSLTEFLLSCDIKPDEYMSEIPAYYLNSSTIEQYKISSTVTSISRASFYNCSSLTSITIPDSVTSIGSSAFYSCKNLTSITIPNSVTSIGDEAFSWCIRLVSITIPDSVTTIGERAFSDCKSLTSITIPDSVTSIDGYAFSGCSSLTSITIPNSVTYISSGAFQCRKLTDISFDGTLEEWESIGLATHAFRGVPASCVRCKDGVTDLE